MFTHKIRIFAGATALAAALFCAAPVMAADTVNEFTPNYVKGGDISVISSGTTPVHTSAMTRSQAIEMFRPDAGDVARHPVRDMPTTVHTPSSGFSREQAIELSRPQYSWTENPLVKN